MVSYLVTFRPSRLRQNFRWLSPNYKAEDVTLQNMTIPTYFLCYLLQCSPSSHSSIFSFYFHVSCFYPFLAPLFFILSLSFLLSVATERLISLFSFPKTPVSNLGQDSGCSWGCFRNSTQSFVANPGIVSHITTISYQTPWFIVH